MRLLILSLLAGPGCFIELPERFDDGGLELPEPPDALTGTNPSPEPGGALAPPSGQPSMPPSRPAPETQPPSAGPPSGPPTAAPTAPPACEAGLCEACDADGRRVPLATDARCPDTDCEAFPQVAGGRDPVTGGPFCEIRSTRMARTCSDARACLTATAETCLPDGGVDTALRGDSSCTDIVGCSAGGAPRIVDVPQGQACVGGAGTCDGAGHCRENDVCNQTALSDEERFCAAAPGLDSGICRFHILPGAADADPDPGDFTLELNCGHFCRQHGWICASMWENLGTCGLCSADVPQLCQVDDACNRTLAVGLADGWLPFDGMLCDCYVDPIPPQVEDGDPDHDEDWQNGHP